MRRILLGTTALMAVGTWAGAAVAQSANEPIKLTLGGYWRGAGGTVIESSGPANNGHFKQGFQQDAVVNVNGTTKLDNGLGVGVSMQFRAENTDNIKRSYVRFFGSWGEIRFGDDDDSRVQESFTAPQAGSLFGVNTPYFAFTNNPIGTNNTQLPITSTKRAQRIAYFTPKIAGFSFAASYAPDSRKGNLGGAFNGNHGAGGFPTSNDPGQNSQSYSVAGLYNNSFGAFRLQAFAGYTGSRQEAPRPGADRVANPAATSGGVIVGWGPFQIGSTYEHVLNARTPSANTAVQGSTSNLNDNVFDVGLLYTQGPFSASLDWSHGRYTGFGGSGSSDISSSVLAGVCSANCGADAVLNMYQIILDYVLGPGISVGAALGFDYYRSGIAPIPGVVASNNYHDAVLMLGTGLVF